MKVHLDITHPAHVHFFRPVISALELRGDEVVVTSRDKDVTLKLLDFYGMEHQCISRASKSRFHRVWEMLVRDLHLRRILRNNRPDVIVAREGAFAAQAGWLAGCPSVSFDDTDDATLQLASYVPFASRIYTDRAYRRRFGGKHRFFRGVMPLAYLRPGIFTPDPGLLDQYGLDASERIILCRLVNWAATHDLGQSGLDRADLMAFLKELESYGRIVITSEEPLADHMERYRSSIHPAHLHHIMAASALYVGESATMACECAVLGIPSIHISSRSVWYTDVLQRNWGLVTNIRNSKDALELARAVLQDSGAAPRHRRSLEAYISDTDDIVSTVLEAIDEFKA